MIDWLARADTEFSQKARIGTDKTDETPISSVSSVPVRALLQKCDGVSSVSSDDSKAWTAVLFARVPGRGGGRQS